MLILSVNTTWRNKYFYLLPFFAIFHSCFPIHVLLSHSLFSQCLFHSFSLFAISLLSLIVRRITKNKKKKQPNFFNQTEYPRKKNNWIAIQVNQLKRISIIPLLHRSIWSMRLKYIYFFISFWKTGNERIICKYTN